MARSTADPDADRADPSLPFSSTSMPPPSLQGAFALLVWSWLSFSCIVLSLAPRSIPSPLASLVEEISPLTTFRSVPVPTGEPTNTYLPATVDKAEVAPLPQSSVSGPLDLAVETNCFQQMKRKAKTAITVLSSLIAYASINSLARTLNPTAFIWSEEDKDDSTWIASSTSWWDRKTCRWLGLCGATHFHPVSARFGHHKIAAEREEEAPPLWQSYWSSGQNNPDQWDDAERARREIPDYVFDYAPLVHLFSNEQFWPGDIAEHLFHTRPTLNYTPIQSEERPRTLTDLNALNQWDNARYVFLTSNDNVEDRPAWLEGAKNIPTAGDTEEPWADWDGRVDGDIPGDTEESRAKWYDAGHSLQAQSDRRPFDNEDLQPEDFLDDSEMEELRKRYGGHKLHVHKTGGRSEAPAVLLVIDKGNGIVDAFWFYFYSFNLGNVVLNVRFGNHVGDWEHCLVRFHHGKPKALFFSAHSAGEAYSYEAVEKIGRRPVIYSATGTHAMYATPGVHPYILPWGLLHDQTDRGPLWDPLLNSHTYTYDHVNDTLRASTASPLAPTEWFYYKGHWGDKFYPLGDSRQYRFAGQYHYVNGPIGPRFKHLDRHKVCQGPDQSPCVIKNWIGESQRAKRWTSSGTGEEH